MALSFGAPRLRYGALLGLALLDALLPSVPMPQHVLAALSPHIGLWVAVHLLLIPVLALVALTLWPLLDTSSGRWSLLGRVGLACFVLGLGAYAAAQALGVGTLVAYASTQLASTQSVLSTAVDALWVSRSFALVALIGELGWMVAIFALVSVRASSLMTEPLVPIVVVLAVATGFSGMVEGRDNLPFALGTLAVAALLFATAQPRLPLALMALAGVLGTAGVAPGMGAVGVLLLALGLVLQEDVVRALLPVALRSLVTVESSGAAQAEVVSEAVPSVRGKPRTAAGTRTKRDPGAPGSRPAGKGR